MKKLFSKIHFYEREKEIAEVFKEIYSSGKISDSPGSFRFKRTGKVNSGIVSKIF